MPGDLLLGDLLLKAAIDLGVETPEQMESDPSLAIGLANSAFESIIKGSSKMRESIAN